MIVWAGLSPIVQKWTPPLLLGAPIIFQISEMHKETNCPNITDFISGNLISPVKLHEAMLYILLFQSSTYVIGQNGVREILQFGRFISHLSLFKKLPRVKSWVRIGRRPVAFRYIAPMSLQQHWSNASARHRPMRTRADPGANIPLYRYIQRSVYLIYWSLGIYYIKYDKNTIGWNNFAQGYTCFLFVL